MPKLLLMKDPKGWQMLQRLLVDLFSYMSPFLRNGEMPPPVRTLYKGTLRMLLVLLHDFPEFLADHHFSLCDVISPTCVQMRNLILSAFPRNMRLPDPFTPNLQVKMLPEIGQHPRVLSNYAAALQANNLRQDLDGFLQNRQPSFLPTLRARLMLQPGSEAGADTARLNVHVLNALVLYVGVQDIESGPTPQPQSAAMEIFRYLANELESHGRYLFFNAIANQLRYPNSHTHYFSCVFLSLFQSATKENVQEQITRVMLERLIVNRPHPWGLLITFIELMQNRVYNFWSHKFVTCAPEIQRLFESVARSCMTASRAAMSEGLVGGTPA
jgi:CCR4-NOT transcription complex subunit 1